MNKKRKNKAFTLLEILISLFISSFIMLAIYQIYKSSVDYLSYAEISENLNKKAFILIDQLQRDITSALIPVIEKEIKDKKDNKEPENKDQNNKDKKEPDKKDKKEDLNLFSGQIEEDQYIKINNKKIELLKSLNFITTNALEFYGERKVKLVRVGYALKKDKEKSKPEKPVYKLYRLETDKLDNFKFKDLEDEKEKEKDKDKYKKSYIRRDLIATNIKFLSFEYVTLENKDKKEGQKKEELEEIKSFTWPLKKDIKDKNIEYKLPQKIEIKLSFWKDSSLKDDLTLDLIIPVIIYNIAKQEDKKEDKDKKALEQNQAQALGQFQIQSQAQPQTQGQSNISSNTGDMPSPEATLGP